MHRLLSLVIALGATATGWTVASPTTVTASTEPVAAHSSGCGGVVFDDLDFDGEHDETESGVAGVTIRTTDRTGRAITADTDDTGTWHVDLDDDQFPIRLEFETPDGFEPGPTGPHNGSDVQFVDDADSCTGEPTGSFGVFVPGASCAHSATLVTGCYRAADHPDGGRVPAVELVDPSTVDVGAVDGDSADDWLTLAPEPAADVDTVGSIHGIATDWRGNVYAAAFVKRHTTLRSDLNPAGNPTAIYRLRPGAEPELLTIVDRNATDPHDTDGDVRSDAAAFDDVYRTGLGDIEVTNDGTQLFAVDLGRRELVTVALPSGDVTGRRPLTADTLGISRCNATEASPFGDLRPFGLGITSDDRLLVGVVCSAESTVEPGGAIDDEQADARPLGDPTQLRAYVVEMTETVGTAKSVGNGFEVRLAWDLDADRGVTYDNGLLSNAAVWRPWVDAVPFRTEHDVVSYPQPAVTDIDVDGAGNLIVALGDRWGHQTMPDSTAPTTDGDTHDIVETVIAGDLQRACPDGDGWVIEGTGDCDGGVGNGFEFFDGDSYGWHAETTLGGVVTMPDDGTGKEAVVVTQMDPLVGWAEPWRSGGIAWHDTSTGEFVRGVRLYDGRNAEPDHTFEKSSGLAGLALLCETAPIEIGGRVWRDVDGDGDQDADEPSIGGVEMELRAPDGVVLTTAVTDSDGRYRFRDDGKVPLADRDDYLVTVAHRNSTSGPFGRWGEHTGLRPTHPHLGGDARLDSDALVAQDDTTVSGMTYAPVHAGDDPDTPALEPLVDHSTDFGFQEQYDLAVATRWVRHDDVLGVLAFEIIIHNQGSEPSGAFSFVDRIPYGTSVLAASHGADTDATDGRTIRWHITESAQLAPGETRRLTVIVNVDDPGQSPFVNVVELTGYADRDDDSTPGNETADSIRNRPNAYTADGGIIDDNGAWAEEDDADIATVHLHQITGRLWVDPDRDADYEPNDLVGDTAWERPVAGVAVVLRHVDGAEVERQWTSHDGTYRFTMVPSDEYVLEVQPDEFTDARPLGDYDWLSSPYRSGRIERLDGVTIPVELRAGDDAVVTIDLPVAKRGGIAWLGWYRTEFVLPVLIAAAVVLLLLQRRANRITALA
ncbi:SdrD B-like protein [Ilumatobacter fluminis]|uniref:SdrD B-like protein n=1 Tax=Ilumatobacter fluminis TaxID=467091 RepID=A0A4R7HU55_9ACTN|nr:SdrD B-like domain-containing protein [Ilumatobacter fluminis]TDT14487.1 SdrD B-like protein [Ilumatobacter fluminis]